MPLSYKKEIVINYLKCMDASLTLMDFSPGKNTICLFRDILR